MYGILFLLSGIAPEPFDTAPLYLLSHHCKLYPSHAASVFKVMDQLLIQCKACACLHSHLHAHIGGIHDQWTTSGCLATDLTLVCNHVHLHSGTNPAARLNHAQDCDQAQCCCCVTCPATPSNQHTELSPTGNRRRLQKTVRCQQHPITPQQSITQEAATRITAKLPQCVFSLLSAHACTALLAA